jgi:hypothetical protein
MNTTVVSGSVPGIGAVSHYFTHTPHPQDSELGVVQLQGQQFVIRLSDWESHLFPAGYAGVIIPVGSHLPKTETWAFLKHTRYKVKKSVIKGVQSDGLLVPACFPYYDPFTLTIPVIVPTVPSVVVLDGSKELDADIELRDKFLRPPHFLKYAYHKDVFKKGDNVIVSETVHGPCAGFALIDGVFYVRSNKHIIPRDEKNIFWKLALQHNIEEILRTKYSTAKSACVYVKLYGANLSSFPYETNLGYGVYDIRLDGKFLDFYQLTRFCNTTGLLLFPILYRGKYMENVVKYLGTASKLSEVCQVQEIVIRPEAEVRVTIANVPYRKIVRHS